MSEINKRPVILDGDPGHDDAVAWVIAAKCEEFDIKAITTVAGNQTLEKVTYNAQRIAALCGIDCPIAKGAAVPLVGNLIIAPGYHGVSGLDGPKLPEPKRAIENIPAVELMAKVLKESKDKVTIIATGPQTNVACLLLAHPELKEKIEVISLMGGGLRNGNWTAPAEFNILEDPEAAYIEYHSGVPIIMAGLDVTEKAMIFPSEWEEFRNMGNDVARTVAEWLDFFFKHLHEIGWEGATLHDPCAVLALVHPEIFTMKDMYIEIETKGEYCRGETVPDWDNRLGKDSNVKVILDLDRVRFVELLKEYTRKYGGK